MPYPQASWLGLPRLFVISFRQVALTSLLTAPLANVTPRASLIALLTFLALTLAGPFLRPFISCRSKPLQNSTIVFIFIEDLKHLSLLQSLA